MAFPKGTIYAVATYVITDKNRCGSFHIYTKQTSNLEIMTAYYEEQKARHTDRITVLVPRDTAEKMHTTWLNAYRRNIGRELSREQKKQSLLGHGELTDRELRRAMAKRY